MKMKDKNEFDRLITLKEVSMNDKESCQYLISQYIIKDFTYCLTCDGSVRQAFKILSRFWYENHKRWRNIPLLSKKTNT